MQGKRTLVGRELMEVIDLYRWGARMSDLCMLYDLHRATIRTQLKIHGVKMRPPHAPPLAYTPDRSDGRKIKSSRPQIPAGARIDDAHPTPDQLLRSSAHAQRDMRTAARQLGVSIGSCPEAAYECRYAFLRSGNRLPDLE